MDLIFQFIEEEKQRQIRGLELIASENFVSENVLKALGSILTNKYAEGYPGKRYYGGCEIIDKVEDLAINRLKELFGAEYANVQPHSGSQANAAVYLACLKTGDKIMGLDLSHGGHLTHGSPVNFSGIRFETVFYGIDKETGLIDYDAMEETAKKEKPNLIICGASAYSRDIDYKRFRKVADEIGALLMADIAHPAGLIAKGLLNDPLPHCHIVTSTTHKTLRGPRGGIIMMGKDFENPWGQKFKGEPRMMSKILDSAVFPGNQGGPLEHVIAAKAVAFAEALTTDFKKYAEQIIKNAKALSESLIRKDYNIVSGGTDNHVMLIDLRNKNVTGKDAEIALVKADITCNKNMVPFDTQSPFITSGIRLGTAAITTRGLLENDMEIIADYIDLVIKNHNDECKLESIGKDVMNMMNNKSLYIW